MKSNTCILQFAACALAFVLTGCGGGEVDGAAGVGVWTDAGPPETSGPVDASLGPAADASLPPVAPVDASGPADTGSACTMSFPSVTDFGAKGPFATTKDDATTIASLQSAGCTIYRPTTLGGDAGVLQHPVVVWGNGTGTPTELVYEWLFTQWASHGFVVAAANTPNAGTGVEMRLPRLGADTKHHPR